MTSELTSEPIRGSAYDDPGLRRHLLISERLRQRRRELGLTQKEVVARLRRLGVVTTNKSLSSLEHGAGVDVGKLPELARVLECSLTYVMGLTSDPASWEPDDRSWSEQARERPRPAARPTVRAVTTPPAEVPATPMVLGPMG